MDSSVPSVEDECPLTHLTDSYQLQQEFEESMRQADFIIHDENARRLQLRILILEEDNEKLHIQIDEEHDRMYSLEDERDQLLKDVQYADEKALGFEEEVRSRTKELNSLKAELVSLNGSSMDVAKHLTEKLALAREIATMKPELEHLRVQAISQSNVLSEKLSLQRQLSTLEVELETEKRASKNAASKKLTGGEDGLYAQMEDLQKELAKERREHDKAKRTAQKEAAELQSRNEQLERKLDDFRDKLRSTKDQLKLAKEGLKHSQVAADKQAGSKDTAATSKKRSAVQISSDAAIGTPDGVAGRGRRPGAKRGKPDQTTFGEKSTFSITPFLNRTLNMAPDTPATEPETETLPGEGNDVVPQDGSPSHILKKVCSVIEASQSPPAVTKKEQSAGKVLERKVLEETKTNSMNPKMILKKQRNVGTLEKVIEEENGDGNEEPVVAKPLGISNKNFMKSVSKTSDTSSEPVQPKKKRRKLLGSSGKTLFDDDDSEAPKRPAKAAFGRPTGRIGAVGSLLAAPTSSAFGAFSPLKKDRRGVNASFLA